MVFIPFQFQFSSWFLFLHLWFMYIVLIQNPIFLFQFDFLRDIIGTKSRHYAICMNGYTYFQDGNFDIHDSIKKFYHQSGFVYSTFSWREGKCCGFCMDYVTLFFFYCFKFGLKLKTISSMNTYRYLVDYLTIYIFWTVLKLAFKKNRKKVKLKLKTTQHLGT